MSLLKIPCYEGSSPFIYVYCAKEDERLALPVLTRLYNEGLRMWVSQGSVNATDVHASRRIDACTALLIFLSGHLDDAVRREDFEAMSALRCNKVKYFVRLEKMELSYDWGESDANIIIDYVRSNEAAFWLSIYDSALIERCRGPWPEVKLSAAAPKYDSVDKSDIDDEYASLSQIIESAPRYDRYGAPVNAQDIALFAGMGDLEDEEEPEEELLAEPQLDEASRLQENNRRSMDALMGMLDDISVVTQQRTEALRQQVEQRQQARRQLESDRASLPFTQKGPEIDSAEPPVPALSFMEDAYAVDFAAGEMFGDEPQMPEQEQENPETQPEPPETEIVAGETTVEEQENPESEEADGEAAEEAAGYEAEAEPQLSFEEFIDGLVGLPPIADTAQAPVAEAAADETEQPENIEQPQVRQQPQVKGLADYVLPDDRFVEPEYVEHYDDEGEALPSAQERAETARLHHQAFKRAVEVAAFKVTGKVAVKKRSGTPTQKKSGKEQPKRYRQEPTRKVRVVVPASVSEPSEPEPQEEKLTRIQRSRMRREQRLQEQTEQQVAPQTEEAEQPQRKRKSVRTAPEPVKLYGKQAPPAVEPEKPVAEVPAAAAEASEPTEKPKKRKGGFPHKSSGLLGMLRNMHQRGQENSSEADGQTESIDTENE